ncbi:hypothetical protein MBLNU13_g04073t1 [Cladosporium sp. NU13]
MASSSRSKKPNNSKIIEISSSSDAEEQSTQARVRPASNVAAVEIIEIPDSDDEEPSSPEAEARAAVDAAAAVSSAKDELHPALLQLRRPYEDLTIAQRASLQSATNTASASGNDTAFLRQETITPLLQQCLSNTAFS